MKTIKLFLSSIALMTVSSFAIADNNSNDNLNYAPVVDVQPIYEKMRVPQSRRVCNDERRSNRHRRSHVRNQNNNSGAAIFGGLIGGLLGNHFGDGRGRDASTALGIIAGAAIGSQASNNGYRGTRNSRYSRNRYSSNRHGNRSNNRQRRSGCYRQRDYYEEERIVGYNVSYDYLGRIYHTRMHNHPGERVKINVRVQVAEY